MRYNSFGRTDGLQHTSTDDPIERRDMGILLGGDFSGGRIFQGGVLRGNGDSPRGILRGGNYLEGRILRGVTFSGREF